jgi:hypothetical protein
MYTPRVTLSDRREYADQTTVRWRVMILTALIGLAAGLVVWIWGDQESRADEGLVLIVTVLGSASRPSSWVLRFAFARVNTLFGSPGWGPRPARTRAR